MSVGGREGRTRLVGEWSSDVCASDLRWRRWPRSACPWPRIRPLRDKRAGLRGHGHADRGHRLHRRDEGDLQAPGGRHLSCDLRHEECRRSEARRVGKECRCPLGAEKGVRDWSVSGVQTCALPIYDGGDGLDLLVHGLEYDHSETSGPVFEAMDMQIEAIASIVGMKGIFKLRAADIYRVISVTKNVDERIPLPDIDEPAGRR